MAEIRLEQMRKTFGAFVAVEELDLEIRDGELLVLLGPSGCGKTTTLNCIAGLEQPSKGRILFNGQDVTDQPPHARNIAMVFQSALLYPHMTARQNVALALRHALRKPKAEADAIAETSASANGWYFDNTAANATFGQVWAAGFDEDNNLLEHE